MAKHTEDGVIMSRGEIVVGWLFVALFAVIVAFGMFGCNTIAGLGKDIQASAEGIRAEMAKD